MCRMPGIVAHRGGAGLRPENTLAACAHAVSLGVDGLEIDIRLSRDNEVVVFHDPVPDPDHVRGRNGERLSGRPPPVRELLLRELKAFDVGYPRASRAGISAAPGERIPTLSELLGFLDSFPQMPLLLVELKTDFHTGSPLDPYKLTDAVLHVLADQVRDGPVRLLSFDWRCLVHAMRAVPPQRCVFLTVPEGPKPAPDNPPWFAGQAPSRHGGSFAGAIGALGGRHWGPHYHQLTPESVSEAHAAAMEVSVWTVNEPDQMRRMQALGINHLITDYPNRALALFSRPDTEARRGG